MLPAQMTDTLRDVSLEGASPFVKELGNFGYGIGDTLMALPFGPHIAPILLASEAGGKTAYDIVKRGGTPEQAFWGGITTAAIEWATNIIPIGKLFKIAEPGTKFFSKEAVTNILKQAGIGGAQGWVTDITETFADYAIMGDRSQLGMRLKDLIDSGMDPGEAQKQAFNEFFVVNSLQAMAGSALSGGAFAAGANAVSGIRTNMQQNTGTPEVLDLQGKSGYNIGEKSGNSSYDAYLKMLDEVDAANRSGMTAREFAESKGVASTFTDAEAAAANASNYRMADGEGEITTKVYTAPSTRKEITTRVKGDVAVPIDKVEKYLRGDVPNPMQELKELNKLKQSNRKLFDSNPENVKRLRELRKLSHNYDRSVDMSAKLESIGLDNTNQNNNIIAELLLDAGNKVTADNRIITSIMAGPGGRLKIVSIWTILPDGTKYLSTIKLMPI